MDDRVMKYKVVGIRNNTSVSETTSVQGTPTNVVHCDLKERNFLQGAVDSFLKQLNRLGSNYFPLAVRRVIGNKLTLRSLHVNSVSSDCFQNEKLGISAEMSAKTNNSRKATSTTGTNPFFNVSFMFSAPFAFFVCCPGKSLQSRILQPRFPPFLFLKYIKGITPCQRGMPILLNNYART